MVYKGPPGPAAFVPQLAPLNVEGIGSYGSGSYGSGYGNGYRSYADNDAYSLNSYKSGNPYKSSEFIGEIVRNEAKLRQNQLKKNQFANSLFLNLIA